MGVETNANRMKASVGSNKRCNKRSLKRLRKKLPSQNFVANFQRYIKSHYATIESLLLVTCRGNGVHWRHLSDKFLRLLRVMKSQQQRIVLRLHDRARLRRLDSLVDQFLNAIVVRVPPYESDVTVIFESGEKQELKREIAAEIPWSGPNGHPVRMRIRRETDDGSLKTAELSLDRIHFEDDGSVQDSEWKKVSLQNRRSKFKLDLHMKWCGPSDDFGDWNLKLAEAEEDLGIQLRTSFPKRENFRNISAIF